MKWVGSLYRKARYITMSLQLIPTNPKTNLCTIQLSNRLNVPGANFEQSIDCWIDLLKKRPNYLSLLLVTFAPQGPDDDYLIYRSIILLFEIYC